MLKKFLCVFLILPAIVFSETRLESKGEQLTYQFWKAVQKKNTKKIWSYLSSDFQASSTDGAIDRKQEIHMLQALPITEFTIMNARSTKSDHRIVVTFDLKLVNETSSSYFHQLFVWIHTGGHWKLIADTFIQYNP
jgi:hypothetical protein